MATSADGLAADPLAALRAVRLPAPPPSSLAEMLMLAAAAGILAAAILVGILAARQLLARRRAPVRAALAGLGTAAGLPPAERLAEEARLLRGYVAAVAGPEAAAARDGEWLDRLDRTFATDFFTAGEGRVFGETLYGPADAVDPAAIDGELRVLLKRGGRR